MNNIFFKPWKGKNFESSGYRGKKILILGESHYCKIDEICAVCGVTGLPGCNDFTNSTVRKFLAYKNGGCGHERWMNTYTRFGNILENRYLDADETSVLWHSVAFYNYVQIAVIDKRVSPSTENFSKSGDAFYQVVSELLPDLIIVWGDRLWRNMPETGRDVQIDGAPYYVYTLKSGFQVLAIYVYHPASSAFDYGAHETLAKAIDSCKRPGARATFG